MKNQQNINSNSSRAENGPNKKYTVGIPITPKTSVSKRTAKSCINAYFRPRSGLESLSIQYLILVSISRREICGTLCSNYTLKDKKLIIEADYLLFAIKEVKETSSFTPSPVEPTQKGSTAPQMEPSYVLSPNELAS